MEELKRSKAGNSSVKRAPVDTWPELRRPVAVKTTVSQETQICGNFIGQRLQVTENKQERMHRLTHCNGCLQHARGQSVNCKLGRSSLVSGGKTPSIFQANDLATHECKQGYGGKCQHSILFDVNLAHSEMLCSMVDMVVSKPLCQHRRG